MITIKQLETVFWVSRLKTFQKAAERLNTTQSAISKRVSELEDEMGFEIFNRQQRVLGLTSRGEQLLKLAERSLAIVDQISDLKNQSHAPSGLFRFGVTEMVSLTWLPAAVAEMQRQFPGLVIQSEVAMERTLHAGLMSGKLDLAILHDVIPEPDYVIQPLASVRYDFMGSPELVDGRTFHSIRELYEYQLIHQGSYSWSGLALNKWLSSQGLTFPRTMSCSSLLTVARLTIAKVGISCLPFDCLQPAIQSGQLQVLDVTPKVPDISYSIVYRDNSLNKSNEQLAEIIARMSDFSMHVPLGI